MSDFILGNAIKIAGTWLYDYLKMVTIRRKQSLALSEFLKSYLDYHIANVEMKVTVVGFLMSEI